jgi:hypothetical protein
MATRFSKGPWTAVTSARRKQPLWEIHSAHRDRIAVVYTGKADAELMADARSLLTELKHLVAIVRLREGGLRASEQAALERARALIAAH